MNPSLLSLSLLDPCPCVRRFMVMAARFPPSFSSPSYLRHISPKEMWTGSTEKTKEEEKKKKKEKKKEESIVGRESGVARYYVVGGFFFSLILFFSSVSDLFALRRQRGRSKKQKQKNKNRQLPCPLGIGFPSNFHHGMRVCVRAGRKETKKEEEKKRQTTPRAPPRS